MNGQTVEKLLLVVLVMLALFVVAFLIVKGVNW
jgi:hypothetical protein